MSSSDLSRKFLELIDIMKRLRDENGCPWDRKQTHESLVPYLLEESYEAIGAIETGDWEGLSGELGDVLLQILFHTRIAEESNEFTMATVLDTLTRKLIRRHPHVFGTVSVDDAEEVLRNWQLIKRDEAREGGARSVLDGLTSALPQLTYAQKSQERAAQVGFDWDTTDQVKEKVREEWRELWESVDGSESPKRIEEEMGDLLFALVNLARFLNVQPEEALRKANLKFARRFREVELRAGGGDTMKTMGLESLDAIWNDVKADERDDSVSVE